MNKLEQLKKLSTVVADTGDIEAIKIYQPLDATTNPSLILKASLLPQYQPLLLEACEYAKQANSSKEQRDLACDKLATLIGREILTNIEGRVSTEVDARLSFDTKATVAKAHLLIRLYEECGIDKSRILIKIASTWEGIQAAKILEKDNIQCNLTLLFNQAQAQACADVGAFLISPFVGRISDWYGIDSLSADYNSDNDPGVMSVKSIYDFYKSHDYNTVIMAASFRSTAQVEALAGCDRLTISPNLLQQLSEDEGMLGAQLKTASSSVSKPSAITEAAWKESVNNDDMGSEKLAEGITLFAQDQKKLELSFDFDK